MGSAVAAAVEGGVVVAAAVVRFASSSHDVYPVRQVYAHVVLLKTAATQFFQMPTDAQGPKPVEQSSHCASFSGIGRVTVWGTVSLAAEVVLAATVIGGYAKEYTGPCRQEM